MSCPYFFILSYLWGGLLQLDRHPVLRPQQGPNVQVSIYQMYQTSTSVLTLAELILYKEYSIFTIIHAFCTLAATSMPIAPYYILCDMAMMSCWHNVLADQNLWVTVLFSTPAFIWTRASTFTTRSTTRQTIPAKPRQIILWWRRAVHLKTPPSYIHLRCA